MTKEMIDQSAVAGRVEPDSMEQEEDRMDEEATNATGTDCPRQTVEDYNETTNREGNQTRERDVQETHTGKPSWESTQPEGTGEGRHSNQPKTIKKMKVKK